jgi:hypothetical protein
MTANESARTGQPGWDRCSDAVRRGHLGQEDRLKLTVGRFDR